MTALRDKEHALLVLATELFESKRGLHGDYVHDLLEELLGTSFELL